MKKKFFLLLSGMVLLASCGGGSGSSSSSSGGGALIKTDNKVSIDAMTSVPVINGSSTQGTLYVHNYSNVDAKGLVFSLGSTTVGTKLKLALAKAGLNLGGYEDTSGFILVNPGNCTSIPAGGSCAVKFMTPNLTVGNLGSSLVKLAYNYGNTKLETSQVVNYNYVNVTASHGVNFTGGLNVVAPQGDTRHVVGYVYGSGAIGSVYKTVQLSSNNATTRISNGFINGQEVAVGQVIPVEFAVALQNNKASSINVTPSWSNSVLQANLLDSSGGGSPLTLSLIPSQAKVNYLFGNIPILAAPTAAPATINVVNNGNIISNGSLTVSVSGANASDLTITNGCEGGSLLPNAGNSCQIGFATTSFTTGTALVEYKNGNNVVGQQTVMWINGQLYPAVSIVPNPSSISFNMDDGLSSQISFLINNIGKAALNNVGYSVVNTGPATWIQDSTTCNSSIGTLASCAIQGHFVGSNKGSGQLYIKTVGDYNGKSYNFVSLPVNYTVTNDANVEITPDDVALNLIANCTNLAT